MTEQNGGRWLLRKHVTPWVPFPGRNWLLLRRSDDADDWVSFGWFPTWGAARERGLEDAALDRW